MEVKRNMRTKLKAKILNKARFILYLMLAIAFHPLSATRLWRDKRAMSSVPRGVVGVLIGMMVTIFIGVIIVTALINSVTPDDTWSTEANNTWATLQANTWLAFSLVVIAPIIIGAVAIMAILRGGGMG